MNTFDYWYDFIIRNGVFVVDNNPNRNTLRRRSYWEIRTKRYEYSVFANQGVDGRNIRIIDKENDFHTFFLESNDCGYGYLLREQLIPLVSLRALV